MQVGFKFFLFVVLLYSGSLWAFTAPSLFTEPIDEQTRLENEVTAQEHLAAPEIMKLQKALENEFQRPAEDLEKGYSLEFKHAFSPTVKEKLNLADTRIPLHKRLVEKERQDMLEAFTSQSEALQRLRRCGPKQPTPAIFGSAEEQAAFFAALQCSRNGGSRFFSEFHLIYEGQRQRIRQLHLPAHSEKARVFYSRELEEQQTAELRAQFDSRIKSWQPLEDVLVFLKGHQVRHTANGPVFSTNAEVAEYRRLIDVMNTATQNRR